MKTELLAWLINATVATSIAGIAILLLRKPLQRWLGAEIAYRLWIAFPLATLAAFFSLPHPAPIASDSVQQTFAAAPAVIVRMTGGLNSIHIGSIDLASINADRWLLAIWLGGACVLFALLVWQQRRFVARLRLRSHGDGSWRSGVENASPAVLGVLRQRLVLPECFETEFSDYEQHLVLAHERMHQQRCDPWALATCAVLRTVFWFNPIVHFAATHFRRDVELACDAAVLRAHPCSRRRYADALLKTQMIDHALPVACLWGSTPPMKERIMLLKNALPARSARLAGAILLGLAALGATGIALAGHDSAFTAASALAAATPVSHATPSMVESSINAPADGAVKDRPQNKRAERRIVIASNDDGTTQPPPLPPVAPIPPTPPTPHVVHAPPLPPVGAMQVPPLPPPPAPMGMLPPPPPPPGSMGMLPPPPPPPAPMGMPPPPPPPPPGMMANGMAPPAPPAPPARMHGPRPPRPPMAPMAPMPSPPPPPPQMAGLAPPPPIPPQVEEAPVAPTPPSSN